MSGYYGPLVIPAHLVVRHVDSAAPNEARVVVNRFLSSNPDWPNLVLLVNGVGTAALLEVMRCAIEHAPDPETKAAWKGLALQFTRAIQGAITS